MKKQVTLFSAVLIAFMLTSCQEDDNLPVIKTKTQLITTGSWNFDKATTGTPPVDISINVPACYKDNVVRFTSATNGAVDNPVVCTPTDVTPATFTWSFQTGETVLSLNAPLFPGGSNDFNLVSLSETSLVISQNVTIPPSPTPTNVVFYYKH